MSIGSDFFMSFPALPQNSTRLHVASAGPGELLTDSPASMALRDSIL